MSCVKPRVAYVVVGEKTANGKKVIVWDEPQNGRFEKIEVACGQCIKCRLKKAGAWANRCGHESAMHAVSSFVTCTYDEENKPYGGSVVRVHGQKLIRALRQKIRPIKIRYFGCGEYGDEKDRPHYHFIIFGYDFPDRVLYSENNGMKLYDSAMLTETWGKGSCKVSDVSPDTMSYVTGYCLKKISGKKADEVNPESGLKYYERLVEETGEIVKIEPEYGAMSLKPGIGATWFEKYKTEVYVTDSVIRKGSEMSVPAYYDTLYEREEPEKYELMKAARVERAIAHTDLLDTTDRRRADIEQCAIARHGSGAVIGTGKYKKGAAVTARDLDDEFRRKK